MNSEQLRDILDAVRSGSLEVEDALKALKWLPYEDIGFAKIDHHRSLRRGFPEAILCQGKSVPQVVSIVQRLLPTAEVVMATKATPEMFAEIRKVADMAEYHEPAKLIIIGRLSAPLAEGQALVVTAGTSDIPIAEEAAITAETMGLSVEKVYDVGVAGLHRLVDHKESLLAAEVIVAVAGMEGALTSVISGLVSVPVVAVPTSVGYGSSFQGLAALLGMLNTCAPGVAVVNIDNGFGAGYLASLILRKGDATR